MSSLFYEKKMFIETIFKRFWNYSLIKHFCSWDDEYNIVWANVYACHKGLT